MTAYSRFMRIKKSIERDCMEQRTEEWFAARLGKVTASRVADVLAKIKSGESASRKNYKMELVVQRLTGKAGSRLPTLRWNGVQSKNHSLGWHTRLIQALL